MTWFLLFTNSIKDSVKSVQAALQKFSDVFQQRHLLISKKYKTLLFFKIGSSNFDALVAMLQPLCEGPIWVIQSEGVEDFCHSLLHPIKVFKTTSLASAWETTKNSWELGLDCKEGEFWCLSLSNSWLPGCNCILVHLTGATATNPGESLSWTLSKPPWSTFCWLSGQREPSRCLCCWKRRESSWPSW